MEHIVKSWGMFFEDILSGERTSDIRLNDRRYAVGDTMLLQEYDPVTSSYTGREQRVEITYLQCNKSNPCAISREALRDDYVVLSIKLLDDITYSIKGWWKKEYDENSVIINIQSSQDLKEGDLLKIVNGKAAKYERSHWSN